MQMGDRVRIRDGVMVVDGSRGMVVSFMPLASVDARAGGRIRDYGVRMDNTAEILGFDAEDLEFES